MTAPNKISYCLHREIDILKWNRCIEESDNGSIYARSFYLNLMAGKWDALVLNDYEAVMPLTWKRKYGFYYLYQPYFIPCLGIFGLKDKGVTVVDFLMAIPGKFRYWHLKLNEANVLPGANSISRLQSRTCNNYLLHLNKPYSEIYKGYRRLCVRMIKRAIDNNVQIVKGGSPAEAIRFYQKLYENQHQHLSADVYENLIKACSICLQQEHAKIYLAALPGGEITAAYLVLIDKRFVYSLIGGSSEKGKQTGSFYLITDAAIKDHAGTERTFRFEGSDIQGIAFFDAQFNPVLINYSQITRNTLPFPFNLFK